MPRPAPLRVSPTLRLAQILTGLIIPLAAWASAGGLLVPGLYGDSPAVAAVIQGQDLVTLLALPFLAIAMRGVGRGSKRALLVWFGLVAYILYTYTGAAFVYDFNAFFLIYVALFSLSLFALVTAAAGLDIDAFGAAFAASAPRLPVVIFLLLMAFILGIGELGQVVQYLMTGAVPELIPGTDAPPNFVFALDLGIIAPLSVLAATGLWRRRTWGQILSGILLIKAATMGLALLAMTWFGARAGLPADGLTMIWFAIAAGGLGLSIWLFRSVHPNKEAYHNATYAGKRNI